MVVSAIDCMNLASINAKDDFELLFNLIQEKKFWITGSYGVRIFRVPPVEIENDFRISSRYLRRDGNKLFSISALSDSNGTIYAMGDIKYPLNSFQNIFSTFLIFHHLL